MLRVYCFVTSLFLLDSLILAGVEQAQAETGACLQNGQVFPMGLVNEDLPEFMVEFNQLNSIQAATKDFKGFCEWNRMDRSSGDLQRDDKSAYRQYIEKKREGDRQKAGDTLSHLSSPPWKASLRGNRNAKLQGGTRLPRGGSYFYSTFTETSPPDNKGSVLLTDFAKKMTANLKVDFKSSYRIPEYGQAKAPTLGFKERVGLCSGVTGALSIPGCASGLARLMPKLEVSQEKASTLDPKLIKATLEDEQITQALKKVSVSLWERIGANNFKPSDDIFTELESALLQNGMTPQEAKNKALQIMGTLSVGGPTFATRGIPEETSAFPQCEPSCNPNNIYLASLAEGLVHADTLKMDQKPPSLYSLPKNVDFPCDSGKNYHFWMSAYYANELVKEGVSAHSARSSVFVSHLGYQMARDEQIGGGGNELLKMGRFTSPENGTRIDLVLASAGAKFGAEGGNTSRSLKVRHAYIEVLKAGSRDPSKEEWTRLADPRKYYKWLDRVGARTALDAF